jgi:hypothetical protein
VSAGYGLRRQWDAGREFADERTWRDWLFLQQLAPNGAFLLQENHSRSWRALIAPLLGANPDEGWGRVRFLLRLLPGEMARKLLWRTSLWWYLLARRAWGLMLIDAAKHGCVEEYLNHPKVQALSEHLDRTEKLLERLEWCWTGERQPQAGPVLQDGEDVKRKSPPPTGAYS